MFTVYQHLNDERLVWGVLSDILFFGSLYFSYFIYKRAKSQEDSQNNPNP